MKVLIAAGGTGGHVIPGIALADELSSRGHQVEFAGGKRIESTLVPDSGYRLHQISGGVLRRSSFSGALRAIATLGRSTLNAMRVVRQGDFDVVVGMGGYHTPGVAWAARTLAKRVVLHEQNAVLSLSNRLAAPFANAVAGSVPLRGASARTLRKFVLTGNPLRREIRSLSETSHSERQELREREALRFGLNPAQPIVLIMGGSLGAKPINDAAYGCADVLMNASVLHLAGKDHADEVRKKWHELGVRAHVVGYTPEIWTAYAAADICVSRAGGMIAELCAVGLPSILIPGPWATYDHQTLNAVYLQQAGGAIHLAQDDDLSDQLRRSLSQLIGDSSKREQIGAAANLLARPLAASGLADLVDGAQKL